MVTFLSPVAEASITCFACPMSLRFSLEKRGVKIADLEAEYPSDWDESVDVIFAMCYSSAHKKARTLANDHVRKDLVDCNFGWLDARELRPPQKHQGFEEFVSVQCAMVYQRLLRPRECKELLEVSPDMRELMLQEPPIGPFPS